MDEQQVADALDRLEALVGEWVVEAVFPQGSPAGVGDLRGRTTFEWVLGRTFLMQRSTAPDPVPEGLCVIGVDAESGGYTQHYFDSRNVARLYAMTFDGERWTLTRESPDFTPLEFSQRFTGDVENDGTVIRGRWEIRHPGADWAHDFELIYSRA